jgi:hypothetical protein
VKPVAFAKTRGFFMSEPVVLGTIDAFVLANCQLLGANSFANNMKRNEASLCRLASALRPGFPDGVARGERQNVRIMSLKMGPPGAPTICNSPTVNDLRPTRENSLQQNAANPERQSHMSPTFDAHPTKCVTRQPFDIHQSKIILQRSS